MSQICQKCGKAYEPKRRGGKFCSTSCRVTRHQLTRKGRVMPYLHSGDELYLANKLQAVERSAREALTRVQSLPAEQALAELEKLVRSWSDVANNAVIEHILRNQAQEMQVNYRAFHERTGLY